MTIKGQYLRSENFEVVDTIGVPHPYCITPEHLVHGAEHFGGILGEPAIELAEKHGAKCGVRGCTLTYKQHKQALLISCSAPLKGEDGNINPELHKLLLDNKGECEKNGYAGFAFIDAAAYRRSREATNVRKQS